MKRTFLLTFCVLSGIVLGGMLGNLCAGVPGLGWLAYTQGISFSPSFDCNVIRLNMELYMGISVAQILTIAASLFLYERLKNV